MAADLAGLHPAVRAKWAALLTGRELAREYLASDFGKPRCRLPEVRLSPVAPFADRSEIRRPVGATTSDRLYMVDLFPRSSTDPAPVAIEGDASAELLNGALTRRCCSHSPRAMVGQRRLLPVGLAPPTVPRQLLRRVGALPRGVGAVDAGAVGLAVAPSTRRCCSPVVPGLVVSPTALAVRRMPCGVGHGHACPTAAVEAKSPTLLSSERRQRQLELALCAPLRHRYQPTAAR